MIDRASARKCCCRQRHHRRRRRRREPSDSVPRSRSHALSGGSGMAHCDLSPPSYSPCENDRRLRKASYSSSRCSACLERESPRKRCRGENVVVDHEMRLREHGNASRRIRSNLCELPTTYVTDNCQSVKLSPSRQAADFIDIKGARCDENNPEADAEHHHQHHHHQYHLHHHHHQQPCFAEPNFGAIGSMTEGNRLQPSHDRLSKLYPRTEESARNINGIASKLNAPPKPWIASSARTDYHFGRAAPLDDAKICEPRRRYELDRAYDAFAAMRRRRESTVSPSPVPPVEVALSRGLLPSASPQFLCRETAIRECGDFATDIRNDTNSCFDKRMDVASLKERYLLEAELLKQKLKDLKSNATEKKATIGPRLKRPATAGLTNTTTQKVVQKCPSKNADLPKQPFEVFNVVSPKKELHSEKLRGNDAETSTKSKRPFQTRQIKDCAKLPKSVCSSDSECSDSEDSDRDCDDVAEEPNTADDASSVSSKDNNELVDAPSWPVRTSLFPNIPPYVFFSDYSARSAQVIPVGGRLFKWKLSTITPVLVRKTITNSGFRLVRSESCQESNEWMGVWGKHMKSPLFKTLKHSQKLNHFPGTFQIGRKDRLWRNFQRMISKFGHKEFGFIPQSYVLPQDLRLLKSHWFSKMSSGEERYIIKPPASARGTGIKVINRWAQLPKRMSLVVQEYISNPYLINGSKFDLRLYVLVTSFNPLRIYLYPDGLARFASVPYSSDSKDLRDKYMHLTNYSINKLSPQYTANENANACKGHKWTISKLFEFMEKRRQVDTKALWKRLRDLVIKTMIAGEASIVQLCKDNMCSRYNCYELFGVDVLLDDNLKCWLLEVNISPSLHSQSPLDEHVKGPLVKTLLDLAQFHLPQQIARAACGKMAPASLDTRLYTIHLMPKESKKHSYFNHFERREDYLNEILDELTGDDVRHLTQAEDEMVAIGEFERIFPTARTHKYLDFMEPRYYNRLFDSWENKYEKRREQGIKLLQNLCEQKIHLKIATPPSIFTNSPSTNPSGETVLQQALEPDQQQTYQQTLLSTAASLSVTPSLVVPIMVAQTQKASALPVKTDRETKCLYETLCFASQLF